MAGKPYVATAFCRCRYALSSPSIPTYLLQATRLFSSTASRSRHGSVPVLAAPSTAPPELVELLDRIRKRIFLPAHLKRPQRRLVFRRKYWDALRTEPISVQIGDEAHKLEPIDRTKDVPDSWKSLIKAMDLLKPGLAAEDLREARLSFTTVFIDLLRGFHIAGRKWKQWQTRYIVRKAIDMQMLPAVIEAARLGGKTGILLNDVGVVREILWGCRDYWQQGTAASQALKYAEQVARLCEEEDHVAGVLDPEHDPRCQPDCIGVLSELAAAVASPESGESPNDALAKARTYAERLVTNLEAGVVSELGDIEKGLLDNGRSIAAADYTLQRWIPVQRGLEATEKLFAEKTPMLDGAQAQLETLKAKVDDAKQSATSAQATGGTKRGFRWAGQL